MMKTVEKRYNMPFRKYFAERMIPQLYDEVSTELTSLLDPSRNWPLAFTTDTWTVENTVQSFMGLTAHWLTDEFCNEFCSGLCTVRWTPYCGRIVGYV